MIRQKILQQLLEWIECNLEHPISIEDNNHFCLHTFRGIAFVIVGNC